MESKESWELRAQCRGKPTQDFFPNSGDKGKKYCVGCPVISMCLGYAVAHDEKGIWGGTSYEERKRYGSKGVREIIRNLFRQYHLLEDRPIHDEEDLPEEIELPEQRQEEQSLEQPYPIAQKGA